MLNAENPLSINAIPRNTKLNPIRTVNAIELNIGQMMKINPKITATIPAAWFCSMFFSSQILFCSLFQMNLRIKKQYAFHINNFMF